MSTAANDKTTTDKAHTVPEPVRKVCDLFRLLAGYEVNGLAPGEIAKGLGVGAPWVSVNLPGLAELGYVERVGETGRWRLGVAFLRIANTVFVANAQAKEQLEERMKRIATPL
jgi:ArsR family transcriptional regulator, arsenate/arsenite/antimonite-responsive transcriptional repressor